MGKTDYCRFITSLHSFREDNAMKLLSRKGAKEFYEEIRELLYFDCYHEVVDKEEMARLLEKAEAHYRDFACTSKDGRCGLFADFLDGLTEVKRLLDSDVEAIYEGDPACASPLEVVLAYPGFIAISAYRIAHLLLKMGYGFVARVISEYAHSRTGVDIHPGATIGESFFIDHGTGIVIGETTVIGKHVKLYQGVTLGALSLREGRALSGKKRHPTIEDKVTIYSGASIFGGETVIGEGSTIGSNAFILSSVPPHSRVKIKPYDLEIVSK